MARLALLCITSLLAGISAGPLQSREHSGSSSSGTLHPIGRCDHKDNVYQPGQTYEYRYFGKAETGLGFADSKTVGLAVDCQVKLSVPEPCEFRMKVVKCDVFERDASPAEHERHSSLEEEVRSMETRQERAPRGFQPSDQTDDLTKAVSQFDIQAQVANGEIVKVIYEEQEDIWVVNFKKGILDALQVRTDVEAPRNTILVNGVHGLCPTKYTTHGTSESIMEDKDIDSCIQASKKHWELSPLTPIWNMSLVSTVMKSRALCSYKLARSSHVESMTCRETHSLLPLPWNTHISAMSTNITQTLRFVGKTSNAQPMDRRLDSKEITSILYEHENSTDIDRDANDNEADEILDDLVKQAIEGFDIGSPAVFDDFVTELRQSDDLTGLVQKAKSGSEDEQEVAKYLLVQGLVQCNAPACLRALTALIQSEDVPSEVFEPIVMALALTKESDPLFLAEITRMCEASPSRTCTLMVGALTNKLLTDDDDEDDDEILENEESKEAVKTAIKFLVELIEDSKCEPGDALDKADEDSDATKIIIALKALGNLGSVAQEYPQKLGVRTQRIEEKIAKCMTDKNVPTNVTITAIHAVRKFVPNQFISDRLLSVLSDRSAKHEVRIAACMQSLRMAKDKASVRNIVKIMDGEPSEQIKAFMVSHLRSVLQSEDPNYKETAELIKQVLQETGKNLPNTKARLPHSVHVELSKFYEVPFLDKDENDFGAQVESTVIFTPKSYMPKAIHFNISGQAWSEYVNILETGVCFQGTEDLVEKVLGPRGVLSKSKILRQAKESLVKVFQMVEDMSYKYLKLDDMKEYGRKAYNTVRTQSFEAIVDRLLNILQDVDTSELQKILEHARNMDTDKLMEIVKKNVPEQSAQLEKVVEKLKRINFREPSEETLVQVLEAFGIPERKCREILSQVSSYGVNINEIIRWLKRQDLSSIRDRLMNVRTGEIQDGANTLLRKAKEFLSYLAEKYDLPDLSTMIEMVQRTLKNPSEFSSVKNDFMETRKRLSGQKSRSQQNSKNKMSKSVFEEDEDDSEETEPSWGKKDNNEDDDETLNKLPWGRNVKSIKRVEDDDDDSNDDDDEELDVVAFVRILGNELGFISLSDILKFFNAEKLMETFNIKGNWREIMDGFDIRPTFAAKAEGIHHVSTGLGLPLQITLNVTGIATVHLKLDPQGGSFRRAALEIEPSGALQIAGGMAIDLPTIHKIEVVSNTTVASEFEMKVRMDIHEKMFELKIEKPDEELDIFHIRHELKLVKDEEDFEPFEEKSNTIDKQKCMPEIVERVTGLKVCAELETSTIRGSKMLSHGPHELRVSIQESSSSGPTDHYKFSGKYNKEASRNNVEFNFKAPSSSHRREVSARLTHDPSRNDIDMDFDMPDQSTPKMKFFVKNLADSSREKYGAEIGFDIETTPRKHYNASVTVIGKIGGYGGSRYRDERVMDVIGSGEFNYTLKGSVQTPVAWVNVSTTTAKCGNKLLMEHNLTYFISENVRIPILKKLRFPNAEERRGVSKFVLCHGIKAEMTGMAYDLQAFIKFITFPAMNVPEPSFKHVTQLKVHRDGRHIGVHANTTWLNSQHELEYFNASITANNLNSVLRLSEPAIIRVNVSRNDWYIGGKSQLRKEGSELTLRSELTAFAHMPECSTMVDCIVKRLKTEAKCTIEILKLKREAFETRPHTHHRFRTERRPCDQASGRPKKMTITVESRLKQKSGSPFSMDRLREVRDFASAKSMGRQFSDGQVWELKSDINFQSSSGSPKQMQSITTFGNDVKDRDTIVNLFIIHNQTATNIPYGLDHFAQLLISREEGLLISVNTSIDKSEDEVLVGVGMVLQIDPSDMEAHIGFNVDTPFVEGSARVEVSKPERGLMQISATTKTESDNNAALNHKLEVVGKVGNGKVSTSLKIKHPKVETEMKSEIDLYSDGSSTDFDAGLEFDYDDEDDSTERRVSKYDNKHRSDRRSNDQNQRRTSAFDESLDEMTRTSGRSRQQSSRRVVRSAPRSRQTSRNTGAYGSQEDDDTTATTTESSYGNDEEDNTNSRDNFRWNSDSSSRQNQRTSGSSFDKPGKHRSTSTTPDYESDNADSSRDRTSGKRGHKSSMTYDNEETFGSSRDQSSKNRGHKSTSTTPDYEESGSDWTPRSGSRSHKSKTTTPDYQESGSSWDRSGKGSRSHKSTTTSDYDNEDSYSFGRSASMHKKSTTTTPDYDNEDSSYRRRYEDNDQDEDSSVFGRKKANRKTSMVSKGSMWNDLFGGAEDETTSQEQGTSFSNRNERSQKKQRMPMESRDEDNSWTGKSGNKWNYKKMRSHLSSVSPRISSLLRIKSLDRELFPTVNVEAKVTIRQVSIDVDVREVPRSLQGVISPAKYSVKGHVDDQKAVLKIVVGNKGEAGIELHIKSQREATGKIYDRGLTTSGETVHAQLTVLLASEDKIQIKFKVDPESTSRMTRKVRETGRQAYDYTARFAKEKGEQGMNEAKRMWSDRSHSVYNHKYTKSYMPDDDSTMEDWKNDAFESGKRYYESSKDYARNMYTDDSVFGTSIEEIVRELNQQRKQVMRYVMDLIRDTPLGEWVQAMPSLDDTVSKITDIVERHFSRQMQVIKSRKSCILMQSCDAMGSARAVQEVSVELARSVDTIRVQDLAQSAFKIIKDLLLNTIRFVKEKARENEAIRAVVGPLNLNELESKMSRAQMPSVEGVVDGIKAAFLVIKDLAVDRFDAVDQDRDGSITVTIPHPFKWSSFKEMPSLTETQRRQSNEYFEKTKRSFNSFKDSYKEKAEFKLPNRDKPVSFKWADIKEFPKKNMPEQTAMIFGERHVMTFDGKVYAIPENADRECTYLLARGMKQKNFALVKDKDTVTITVPEMVISINEKNEVRINNSHSTQLPVESPSKKTKVQLIGDTVEVESEIGLTVKVTGEKKLVVVELSSALWDETAGLLGSNDNEASNDWEMPSGRNADNVEDFLNSYEVGKSSQCRLAKGGRGQSQRCGKSDKCAKLFGSNSPLRKCYQSVDPEEFKTACEEEACGRGDSEKTVCNVVAAYRKACAAENVETDAPENCETCEGGHKEHSQWDVTGAQRKVDAVVLVSEHREMGSTSAAEKIRSIMDAITRKLRQSGGQDVRVALTGFSGSGVHKKGHTHTIDSDQFASAEKLPQALRTLQFKGNEKTSPLEAVEYILDSHDFRPEATKLILVFGAEEKELISGHGDIESAQEKLREQGITLTVFSKYGNEEIKDRDHGINFDGSIFSSKTSGSSQHSGQQGRHQSNAEMPRRQLSFLAKQSRGAVFQLDSLTSGDRSKQQQLEERVASVILEQVKQEENKCKRCVCKETDLQQLISACSVAAC